ncbi:MAG TPA: DNA-processing protein DprA, partial [Streptosporangiaceae bacterium]|nr:DNA-processing protein DprA [Streptosporangiaceae bacterium]
MPRPAASGPYQPEPVLPEAQYEQALTVLRNARNALERTPSMTASLDEEKIRDLLLVFLNAQFEGAAAGEVFNAAGKTDILIRVEDRNVFIAECKIWKGPKTIPDALTQLLGYLAWRDTKQPWSCSSAAGSQLRSSARRSRRSRTTRATRGPSRPARTASATTSSCTPAGIRTGRSGWRSCRSRSRTVDGRLSTCHKRLQQQPGPAERTYGIDACAHRAALAAGGRTVTVLACGPDIAYPREHRGLLAAVAAQGAVISGWPPGTPPGRVRFLLRSRVIAALASGTVVVEAAARGGTLNAARHAGDLGRPLMAVPGPVTSAMSAGCHDLIRE